MYTLETLINENYTYNRKYEVKNTDLRLVNWTAEFLGSIDRTIPQPGDIIICKHPTKDIVYNQGHLETKNLFDEEGKYHICVHPSAPHIDVSNEVIYLSTSGGYWFTEMNPKLKYIGSSEKTFWTWGSAGRRANGGLYFKANVSIWELTTENIY
jgi:signal peptidase I